ncbi:thiolase [Shinella sp. CPCC 100929]|uniref:Thiolase n=1 Tax=Shinella lacus TaxID=2654216 RepID=A0ABT1R1L7_9HYPH|nr:thiolase [Shinella lacus]MCQ4629021.1 thiolase [Shinella lacus]
MTRAKRGSVAVVGAAESDLGRVADHMTPIDLMAQAVQRALADCGLRLQDVDGLFAATSQVRMAPLALAEYLGIRLAYFDGTNIGGSSFMSHLAHAHAAIEAGLCSVAVIAYGSTQRSVSRAAASPREYNAWETPYRPILPTSAYAISAARHMHLYGTTREQLAEVAVAARQWALLNPKAWEKEPLTIDDVLSARMVSDPLTVRDCCLVTDGGGALVLVSAEKAKDLDVAPIYVLGHGETLSHASISSMEDLTVTGAALSGPQAFAMAGATPADMDVTILYDAFTITPILFLEDLGYCPKGEGGRFVTGGAIAPGGTFALNTNGGGLSYCHPGMYGMLGMIEAVQQLRGRSGARQVSDAKMALAHGNGGVLSSQCTVIFGTADTV